MSPRHKRYLYLTAAILLLMALLLLVYAYLPASTHIETISITPTFLNPPLVQP